MTDQVQTLGFVMLETTDLDGAVDFYTRVARLDVSEQRDEEAFLTGGTGYHWLRLRRGERPGVTRVGYEVDDRVTLEQLQKAVEATGIETAEGGDMASDRVDHWVRFVDPGGIPVELYTGMAELSVPPVGAGVELSSLLHTVWRLSAFDASLDFHLDVLGFQVSDWIERSAAFLRCGDAYHHSLALGRAKPGESPFDHLCIQVGSVDDVMRIRHNAERLAVPIDRDLLRHGPSGSISIYLIDPLHGHKVEFCTGHGQVTDPDYRPRTLPARLDSVDIWRKALPARGLDHEPTSAPAWQPRSEQAPA